MEKLQLNMVMNIYIGRVAAIYFAMLFVISTGVNASEKLLDSFSSTQLYYTSVFSGTGSISLSNNTVSYVEGNSSLDVAYTLSQNGSLEVFRSYGTSTLDLSFSPHQLSIRVKGNGLSNQVFKFMLYEDHNMNGNPFEAGDEIFEYVNTSVLQSSTWQLVNIPYSLFTKFGGGSGTLDLNRIGAWRIVVVNESGSTITSNFGIDALTQHTTYNRPSSGSPFLSGSFIQLWNDSGCSCGQWSQAKWEMEFQLMKDACLEKVIVQYGLYDNNAWYSPSSLSYATYSNLTLNRMFAAAEAVGIKIYLGLYFDEHWNVSNKSLAQTYSDLLTKHKAVSDELWNLFGTSNAFAGWYIPQEINDLEWQVSSNRNLLSSWLHDVSSYLKSKSASKKVLIAPFFGPNRPADDLESWWNDVLSVAVNIDEIAPQDGVGTTSKKVDVDVPHYFNAIKNACLTNNVSFSATVESFQQTDGYPINSNPFAAVPATMDSLTVQLREVARFSNQLYQFEWGYMKSSSSSELYEEYKQYAQNNCTVLSISNDVATEKKVYPTLCTSGDVINIEGFQTIDRLSLIELATGRVWELTISNNQFNLPASLSPGVFGVMVHSGDAMNNLKLVVSK